MNPIALYGCFVIVACAFFILGSWLGGWRVRKEAAAERDRLIQATDAQWDEIRRRDRMIQDEDWATFYGRLEKMAAENVVLARELEEKAPYDPKLAGFVEHHRGKAAGIRAVLLATRGWI